MSNTRPERGREAPLVITPLALVRLVRQIAYLLRGRRK
jgi:hypothetical protein